jgi:hypothetical protein
MRYLVLMLLAALPAHADRYQRVADLNGNGVAETFVLTISDSDYATLTISGDGEELTTGPLVWYGLMSGVVPGLDLAPNGSLLVESGNEGIGRGRWNATLTIAYRDGAYRVVGYTRSWYDTIDRDNYGTCDLNLLTGKGFEKVGRGKEVAIRTATKALPVTDWVLFKSEPEACAGH